MQFDILLLVGRILLAFLFVTSAIPKILGDHLEIEAIAALGLPYARTLELTCGICLVVGGVMIALGIGTSFAAMLLAVFTIIVTPLFLRFWNIKGPPKKKVIQAFVTNIGLVGGLCCLAAAGPGLISISYAANFTLIR